MQAGRFGAAILTWHLILLAQFFASVSGDVDPLIVKGSHFFYKTNGTAFIIRGLRYYPYDIDSYQYSQAPDPLSDAFTCDRDLKYLLDLGINVVQVGVFDPEKDHSYCVNALANAGIYILAVLSRSNVRMESNGGATARWNVPIMEQFTGTVDTLAGYTNVLGFFIDAMPYEPEGMPFVKAAIRDVKKHIRDKAYRDIPVGWTAYPVGPSIQYMMCGDNHADFIGPYPSLIDGDCTSSRDIDELVASANGSFIPQIPWSLPCHTDDPSKDNRTFDFVSDVYTDDAMRTLSGAVLSVYVWGNSSRSSSTNGLVALGPPHQPIQPLDGFSALSSALATAQPSFEQSDAYTPTVTARPPCPTQDAEEEFWNIASELPPRPYAPLCSCLMESLRCIVKTVPPDATGDQLAMDIEAVCGSRTKANFEVDCPGLYVNASTGHYGAFSMCNDTVAYSWAVNQRWRRLGDGSCDLNGTAELRDERPPPTDECKFLLDQAGPNGDQTVTAFLEARPAATGQSGPRAGDDRPPPDSRHRLSVGAKAGIGVGIFAFVILALLSILYVLYRKKQEMKSKGESAAYEHDYPDLPEYVPPTTATRQYSSRPHQPEGQGLMQTPLHSPTEH